jgi:hypothetical protein
MEYVLEYWVDYIEIWEKASGKLTKERERERERESGSVPICLPMLPHLLANSVSNDIRLGGFYGDYFFHVNEGCRRF